MKDVKTETAAYKKEYFLFAATTLQKLLGTSDMSWYTKVFFAEAPNI